MRRSEESSAAGAAMIEVLENRRLFAHVAVVVPDQADHATGAERGPHLTLTTFSSHPGGVNRLGRIADGTSNT